MVLCYTCGKLSEVTIADITSVIFLQGIVVHEPCKKVSRTLCLMNSIHWYLQVTVCVLTDEDIRHVPGGSSVEPPGAAEAVPLNTELSVHSGTGAGWNHSVNILFTSSSHLGSVFGFIVLTSPHDLQAYLLQHYDGEALGLKMMMVRNLDDYDNDAGHFSFVLNGCALITVFLLAGELLPFFPQAGSRISRSGVLITLFLLAGDCRHSDDAVLTGSHCEDREVTVFSLLFLFCPSLEKCSQIIRLSHLCCYMLQGLHGMV